MTFQPTKKLKGAELTPSPKRLNTGFSQGRIAIEHTLRGVKVFHIAADPFRILRLGCDDLVMQVSCGLRNLPIDFPLTA